MARSYGLAYYLYRQYTSAGTRAEQIADPDERAEFWAATHEVRPSPMGVRPIERKSHRLGLQSGQSLCAQSICGQLCALQFDHNQRDTQARVRSKLEC